MAALTALGVTVLHGVLFWVVHRRQRRVRVETIHEIREMLTDEVKNQLAVIGASLPMDVPTEYAEQLEDLSRSVDAIAAMMDGLTEEKLTAGTRTYANAAEHDSAEFTPA